MTIYGINIDTPSFLQRLMHEDSMSRCLTVLTITILRRGGWSGTLLASTLEDFMTTSSTEISELSTRWKDLTR